MQGNPEKKELIIDAAETMFHKFGYSKTSMDDIAREAGLGKGTIYYYFESKEDIFLDVAQNHSDDFYKQLRNSISEQNTFIDKFSTAIRLPIKLAYEHAPVFLDAIRNLPENYLHKLESFRDTNKSKMVGVLDEIMALGYKQCLITHTIPSDRIVQIIFNWFLMGDTNIIIKNPESFLRKAEIDYELLIQLMLYGILKRGE